MIMIKKAWELHIPKDPCSIKNTGTEIWAFRFSNLLISLTLNKRTLTYSAILILLLRSKGFIKKLRYMYSEDVDLHFIDTGGCLLQNCCHRLRQISICTYFNNL